MRARLERADEDDGAPFIDMRSDERHIAAHASNLQLASEARQILSGAPMRHPAIHKALLMHVGAASGVDMPRPQLADFATAVLIEAARAVNMQAAVLRILLVSAQAGASTAGLAGALAVAAMGESFDEMAAEAMRRGHVICRLTPI